MQDKNTKKDYKKAMQELNLFFKINWVENKPSLIIMPDRKSLDSALNEETEDWVTASNNGKEIFILSRKAYREESCHPYSKEKYFSLIKHELCHSFQNALTDGNYKPVWLGEGLAIYLSDQLNSDMKPKKLSKFLEFFSQGGKGVYQESGYAIKSLIENFGKQKIINLFKSLVGVYSRREFENKFKKIYGENPTYRFFNNIF